MRLWSKKFYQHTNSISFTQFSMTMPKAKKFKRHKEQSGRAASRKKKIKKKYFINWAAKGTARHRASHKLKTFECWSKKHINSRIRSSIRISGADFYCLNNIHVHFLIFITIATYLKSISFSLSLSPFDPATFYNFFLFHLLCLYSIERNNQFIQIDIDLNIK